MRIGFNIGPLITGHQVRGIGTNTKEVLEILKRVKGLDVIEFQNLSELKGVDLIHYPVFELFRRSLPFNFPYPAVVTVHDVIPLIFPKHFPVGIRARLNLLWQKRALVGAKALITISRASKNDIHQYLGVGLTKIFPIYLGVSEVFRPVKNILRLQAATRRYKLPRKFGLYIGSVNWNKNILNLTQATLDAGLDLVLVGKSFEQQDHLDHPELASFKQFLYKYSRHPHVHIRSYIPTADLVIILNLAEVTLLPSYYEGFGLPILESQACGTPVVTSRTSSMPEVGGDGALYIDPYRVREITEAVILLQKDPSLRKRLVQNGLVNVKRFTWNKTATEMLKVYRHVTNAG